MADYEYTGLMAQSWDILRGDTSDWPDRSFFLNVIQKYGQPVLDIGCGTGRLLIDYLQQGIDIDGIDNSPEMLEICRKKCEKLGIIPNIHHQSMETLNLPRKYRTIIIPSSSLQLLLDPELVTQAMRRFYEHLEPNGVIIAPFMTLWRDGEALESSWTKSALHPANGSIIERDSYARYDPETQLEHTQDTYRMIVDGTIMAEEIHQRSPATRSYTQPQALMLFQDAGLTNISVYSRFTFDPAKNEDSVFTILGQKP